jgi:hypothetical protein
MCVMTKKNYEDLYTVEISKPTTEGEGVTLDDFVAYMPPHAYIFTPCREIWEAASVNARLERVPVLGKNGKPKRRSGKPVTMSPSTWLDQNKPVEQMSWCPGEPMLVRDRLVVDGGWIERNGVTTFNLYRAPRIRLGDAAKAEPWIDHLHAIYDAADADHAAKWLAHRVQQPQVKINHALLLGGAQGIGKDTILEPVKHAVGPWNFHEVSPAHLFGRFNSWAKSVILRVNEARDLGDAEHVNRFSFYDHTKIYTAVPPDVLRVDEKHLREHYVFNCLGFLITTNYKTDGIFLPPDDRRHYVAWSNRAKEKFQPEYWNQLWRWYHDGGFGHVAAYLAELDISGFNPKAPPPKTAAFWDIVSASSAPEDAELADVIDALGQPEAVTLSQLIAKATGGAAEWLLERRNRRAIPHRLERCGYVPVRNLLRSDGLWIIRSMRQVIYAKATLSPAEQLRAARELAKQ